MKLVFILGKKFLKFLSKRNFDLLSLNKEQQEKFLSTIEKKKELDYYDRSYLQYKCQMFFYSKADQVILNVVSCFLLIPFTILALLNFLLMQISDSKFSKEHFLVRNENIAVFYGNDMNIIPESLSERYYITKSKNLIVLDLRSFLFLLKNVYLRFFYHPYFCLKTAIKVALYNANILINKPKVLIVTSEYSFTSSILTRYCEICGCEHINIMHGDKLFYIRDSFFKFHKCYVWHEHYIDLFKKLRADEDQFVVELPVSFNFKNIYPKDEHNSDKRILKYFLGGETKKQLYQLSNFLKLLQDNFHIIIRPHPLNLNMKEITEIFNGIQIENPSEIPITKSLLQADYVSALYSTVLFQGYCLDREIVINDLDKGIYNKLKELDFIGFKLPHLLLTSFYDKSCSMFSES